MRPILPFSCLAAAMGLLAAALPARAAGQNADRPNILWITCEDISPNLGCYGDSYARTPYDVAHDERLNPLDRLLEAADLANGMDARRVEALVRLLRDDEPAIRYWGATGLKHPAPFIRLRTMNVLDRLGERARPALAAIQQARMEAKSHVGDYLERMAEYVPEKFDGPAE